MYFVSTYYTLCWFQLTFLFYLPDCQLCFQVYCMQYKSWLLAHLLSSVLVFMICFLSDRSLFVFCFLHFMFSCSSQTHQYVGASCVHVCRCFPVWFLRCGEGLWPVRGFFCCKNTQQFLPLPCLVQPSIREGVASINTMEMPCQCWPGCPRAPACTGHFELALGTLMQQSYQKKRDSLIENLSSLRALPPRGLLLLFSRVLFSFLNSVKWRGKVRGVSVSLPSLR